MFNSSVDHPPGRSRQPADPPRWPLLAVVWVLLPFAIVGTGVLSASATLALAARHDVPAAVQPFLVGMVEVVSLSGTLLAIFGLTARLRGRAMAAVIGASAVALVAGWQAYGWVGLLAGGFLVYLVHLAAEAWAELRTWPTSTVDSEPDADSAVDSELETVEVSSGLDPDAARAKETTSVLAPPALPEVKGVEPEKVAEAVELLERFPAMGRPTLAAELGVKPYVAYKLLEALRPMRLVETGESA